MYLADQRNVELFMSFFRGRTDMYARRWEKEGRSGYSPAYTFNWDEFMVHKRRGGTLKDFENKQLSPLTELVIKKHLIGQETIGIYPILPDNTTYFLAADFDGEYWNREAISFIASCVHAGISAYLERSRSGNGGHVWIFFSEPYPSYRSRQIGLELIRHTFRVSEFEKEISFDRLFPNQDIISKDGFGNLIALPFQGKSGAEGNTLFLDIESGRPFPDQWKFLLEAKRHSILELDDIHKKLFSNKQGVFFSIKEPSAVASITVCEKLIIPRSQIVPEMASFLKEELNFLNTEYLTKRRIGKSTYKIQKYFKLLEESGDTVLLPKGFLPMLEKFLNSKGIAYSLFYEHPQIENVSYSNSISLTPNQALVVDSAMKHEQGVIIAPPGSGKTIIGLEIIARRKLPALILVHRKQILDQWVDRIQQFLEIPKAHIGQYSGAKKKVGNRITVGLLQSLARNKGLSELKNQFGTIIIDECHHIPASTFREVIGHFNAHYLIGLTATPQRKHNDEKLIYIYIGEIIAQLDKGDFGTASLNVPQPFEIIVRTTNLTIPFIFKTDQFQILTKVICFDTARNQLIVDDIIMQVSNGKKVLVLSERKEHLEILNLYLKGKCETIVISGDNSERERRSKIKQIEEGHYQVILSTGQFFGEGIDVRGIDCLIIAFPFSFEGKLMQYIGRLRENGAQKVIIDYRDQNIPFLERQFTQRKRYYKKVSPIVV